LDFYEETCCEPKPDDIGLPLCESMKRNVYGTYDVEGGRYVGAGLSNDTISYIPVFPTDGGCGTHETVSEVEEKDCCDDEFYTDLEINGERSADIVADNSYGDIYWIGGKYNTTVTVRGSGFWTNRERTETEIVLEGKGFTPAGNGVRIYTDDACGTAHVTIDDDCSVVTHALRATDGHWEFIEMDCPTKGQGASEQIEISLTEFQLYADIGDGKRVSQLLYLVPGNAGTGYEAIQPGDCFHPTCWTGLEFAYVNC